jgi:hypothetical protein
MLKNKVLLKIYNGAIFKEAEAVDFPTSNQKQMYHCT